VDDHEATLRKLAIRDDTFIESVLAREQENESASALDAKKHALVRIAGLVALDAAPPSYMASVEEGLGAGLTREEIVGVLVALMPVVGVARVVSAAPKLGLAVGYDVAHALEELGPPGLWEPRR
jgi:alkylhydroperoxidase/carboxymuconolactone decarboxylase family protein YurZ